MGHVASGSLRRMTDDARAVADTEVAHVRSCRRCTARQQVVATDAAAAGALLAGPSSAAAPADVDAAWRRFTTRPLPAGGRAASVPGHVPPRSWRLLPLAAPSRALAGAAALVVAVAGAGALLATAGAGPAAPSTTVAAPLPAGLQQIADLVGVSTGGGTGVLGGFDTASGTLSLPFGTLHWSSAGPARTVPSPAAAARATGLVVRAPDHLPAGVGPLTEVLVQPAVTATVEFAAGAGPGIAGSKLTVTAGPAVVVVYGSATPGVQAPTLVTVVMGGPQAASTSSSSTASLEAYVISRPGLPAGLLREIHLLGGLAGLLPAGAASGPQVSRVDVHGQPGILVTDGSGIAAGVLWEERGGTVHGVVGLLDRKDVLDVANQVG